ncbi:HD domain-containing protein [Candidatus Enterovibrio escicola]|uniref:HD domain-containing protein n=1 Tax=Candidatus Enterovibrio escicola TaxID=1927127 RepID=UPI001237FBF0|nr:HD domain-containing protein [Candidatus Enterovibrio escacola]
MIEKARKFALQAHEGQRYGSKPYSVHLEAVSKLTVPYGENAQIIAYLHDVVEDTSVTLDDVAHRFGQHISDCVAIVTDEPGSDRAERKIKTNLKMSQVEPVLYEALIVKTADRFANMRACVLGKRDDLLAIYLSEYSDFKQGAFRQGLCDELWDALDEIVDNQRQN